MGKQEVSALKENSRTYVLEDEEVQPSKSDEIALELVEPNMKVVNNRYEIPFPMKVDIVKALPNNCGYALDRTYSLQKSASKNSSLKKTLVDTFHEIVSNNWLVPVDNNPLCKPCGLMWEVEEDRLSVCPDRKLIEVFTRRQMLSVIAGQFDPLGIRGPELLKGKLILHKIAALSIGWDEKLPDDIVGEWKSWIKDLETLDKISIHRYCFDDVDRLAAADILPTLLSSTDFHNSMRKRSINWVRIPPYAPSQGGSWESMVKLFKSSLKRVLDLTRRKPTLIELQTFTLDAVRIVNDRPLTAVSDQPNDLAPICPSSFLGQQLSPYSPIGTFHDRGDLRRDYLYNANLAHKFWLSWVKGYLPTLQARVKWRVAKNNLVPGQLVLVGDSDDISRRGSYRLGRIHEVHPQVRNGVNIVRRATVAVLNKSGKIDHVLRDISKIAPL